MLSATHTTALASGRPLRLTIGVVDVMLKRVVYRLPEAALRLEEPVRILCREGTLDSLLAEIAVHKLDMVPADPPLGEHHQRARLQPPAWGPRHHLFRHPAHGNTPKSLSSLGVAVAG